MNEIPTKYESLLLDALKCAESGEHEQASQLLRDAMKLRFDPRLARALDLVQIAMIRQEPCVRLHGTLGPLVDPSGGVESTLSAPIQSVLGAGLDDSKELNPLDSVDELDAEGSLDLDLEDDPLNSSSMMSFDDIDDLELFEAEISQDAATAVAAVPGPQSPLLRPPAQREGAEPAPPVTPPPVPTAKVGAETPARGEKRPVFGGTNEEEDASAPDAALHRETALTAEAPAIPSAPPFGMEARAGVGARPDAIGVSPVDWPPPSGASGAAAMRPTPALGVPSLHSAPETVSFARKMSAKVLGLTEEARFDDAMNLLEQASPGERNEEWELLREHVESVWLSSLRRRLSPLSRSVQPAVHPSRLRYLGLDAREAHIMSQLDGVLTIEDVVDISGQGQLAGLRLVSRLLERNLVRLR